MEHLCARKKIRVNTTEEEENTGRDIILFKFTDECVKFLSTR